MSNLQFAPTSSYRATAIGIGLGTHGLGRHEERRRGVRHASSKCSVGGEEQNEETASYCRHKMRWQGTMARHKKHHASNMECEEESELGWSQFSDSAPTASGGR